MTLDPNLRKRLQSAGVDPDDIEDPKWAWSRLQESFGRRATLIDRYALEAAHRGVRDHELDPEMRARLTSEVLQAHDPDWKLVAGSERSRRDPVEVVPYDRSWPVRFDEWRNRLWQRLVPVARRIEHIGSTAVPGLDAKPVVDIQVSVLDPEDEDSYVAAIEDLGVSLRSREGEGHRYFRPAGARKRTVQIHVCQTGSEWERTHILFRDYLRAESAARNAYASLKRDLARRYRDDRIAYTEGKTGFILDTVEEADIWARRTGWKLPPETTERLS